MLRIVGLTVLLALGSGAVFAEDLMEVYQRALVNDPVIRQADANRRAALENRPQAIASLLPQLQATAGYQLSERDGFSQQAFLNENNEPEINNSAGRYRPEAENWSLQLQQSVFRWENWVALRRADKQIAQATADFQAAQQDLLLRVSRAYFNTLAARDNLVAQEANLEAVSRQLEQADKRFEVGLIAITDVQEARAARDTAAADVIGAKRQLASSEEALREITGEKYSTLSMPGDDLPLRSPEPASEDEWVQTSMEQNLALISSRLAADIARDDVRTATGGYLPSIDLTANYGNTTSTTPTLLEGAVIERDAEADQDTSAVGLQFTLPLFAGGGTRSRVRQQEFLWQAARERLESTSRATERQARDAFLGVTSEIARVNALKQALESSNTALRATEAGYEVGTRTTVDVLDARRTAVQAFTNLSRSKYDYLINILNLRQAAGTLDEDTLAEVNSWLDETVQTAPLPGSPERAN